MMNCFKIKIKMISHIRHIAIIFQQQYALSVTGIGEIILLNAICFSFH